MNRSNHHINYQEVIDILDCQHRSIFPAEFHGYMCGIICGGNYAANEAGFRMVLDMLRDDGFKSQDAKEIAAKLMLNTFHQLHDVNCEFKLLLPDDNQSMEMRSKALVGWCQNFLGGLGLSGVDDKELQQDDIKEALYDLSEIAKLYCGDASPEEREQYEFELMELVEYVRVAALLIYTESVGCNQSVDSQH
jgi:yecA family protein